MLTLMSDKSRPRPPWQLPEADDAALLARVREYSDRLNACRDQVPRDVQLLLDELAATVRQIGDEWEEHYTMQPWFISMPDDESHGYQAMCFLCDSWQADTRNSFSDAHIDLHEHLESADHAAKLDQWTQDATKWHHRR